MSIGCKTWQKWLWFTNKPRFRQFWRDSGEQGWKVKVIRPRTLNGHISGTNQATVMGQRHYKSKNFYLSNYIYTIPDYITLYHHTFHVASCNYLSIYHHIIHEIHMKIMWHNHMALSHHTYHVTLYNYLWLYHHTIHLTHMNIMSHNYITLSLHVTTIISHCISSHNYITWYHHTFRQLHIIILHSVTTLFM